MGLVHKPPRRQRRLSEMNANGTKGWRRCLRLSVVVEIEDDVCLLLVDTHREHTLHRADSELPHLDCFLTMWSVATARGLSCRVSKQVP